MKEAAEVKKQIDSGKLKGKELKSAKWLYYDLRYRAKRRALGLKGSRPSSTEKRKRKHKVNLEQPFLPRFLNQVSVARIEELVAQKLYGDAVAKAFANAAKSKRRKAS